MSDKRLMLLFALLLLLAVPLLAQDAPPAAFDAAVTAANISNPELGEPVNWSWQQLSPTTSSTLGCTLATGYDLGMFVTPYRFSLEFASGSYSVYASADGSQVQLCDEKFADISQQPTATPDPEATAEPTVDPTVCILSPAGAYSNIRSSPSVNAVVVDVIYENASHPVIGRNDDWTWYLIDKGWIFNTVAIISGDCSSLLLRNDLVLDNPDGDAAGTPNNYACPMDYAGYLPPRLQRGDAFAVVDIDGVPNRIRATPSTTAVQMGEIQPGQTVQLLDGPACNEGFVWWYVRYQDIDGWTVENNAATQTYYLSSAAQPMDDMVSLSQQAGDVLAFSPDGRLLAVSDVSDEGLTVNVFDVTTDEIIARLTHESAVNGIVFHPDIPDVLAVSTTHAVIFWELESQSVTRVLRDASLLIDDYAIDFNADWSMMAVTSCLEANETTCATGEVRLWDVATGTLSRSIAFAPGLVPTLLEFSPDGDLLLISDSTSTALYDPATGQEKTSIETIMAWVEDIAFSRDGERILLAGCFTNDLEVCTQGAIEVRDTATATAIQVVRSDAVVTAATFGPNGEHVIGAAGTDIMLWEVNSAFVIETLTGHAATITAFVLSEDGRVIASVDEDNVLQVRTIEVPMTTSVG